MTQDQSKLAGLKPGRRAEILAAMDYMDPRESAIVNELLDALDDYGSRLLTARRKITQLRQLARQLATKDTP